VGIACIGWDYNELREYHVLAGIAKQRLKVARGVPTFEETSTGSPSFVFFVCRYRFTISIDGIGQQYRSKEFSHHVLQ
jgi:hypothetical protein